MTTSKIALVTVALLSATACSANASTCSGALIRNQGNIYIQFEVGKEGACFIDQSDARTVLAIYKVGRVCTIRGRIVDTEHEAVEMHDITSVSKGK